MPIREAIARLIAPEPEPPAPDPRIAELEARLAKLDKRLSMTMGALQAATAQLAGLDKRTAEALSTARQANQQATTARSTAESVADAIEALEDGPDTSVLDGSVAKIREQLASGAFDDRLDALAAAERAGKARKGVLAVLEARR